jgi:hypothetical protein
MKQEHIATLGSDTTKGNIRQTIRNVLPVIGDRVFTHIELADILREHKEFKHIDDIKETTRRTLWYLSDEGLVSKVGKRARWRAAK